MASNHTDPLPLDGTDHPIDDGTSPGIIAPLPPVDLTESSIDPVVVEWRQRLIALIGPTGYSPIMRRSLQSLLLFEAKRSISHRLGDLRPYQRKSAFLDHVHYLLNCLGPNFFLSSKHQVQVLYRTMASRVPLDGDTAWGKLKSIFRELKALNELIVPFVNRSSSHKESVDRLVQYLFVSEWKLLVLVHFLCVPSSYTCLYTICVSL